MEESVKELYMQIGALKALDYIKVTATSANVLIYQQMKESKIYREIGYSNWEDFCKGELSVSYKTIDEAIANLRNLGAALYDSAQQIGITSRQFKQLRGMSSQIQTSDDGGSVIINGELIPLTPAAKDELEEAINDLLADKDQQINKLKQEGETKDKLREKQQDRIHQLEHEVDDLRESQKRNPPESIKLLEKYESAIDAMFFALDPENPKLDIEDSEVKARYAALLYKINMLSTAAYDTADGMFGLSSRDLHQAE